MKTALIVFGLCVLFLIGNLLLLRDWPKRQKRDNPDTDHDVKVNSATQQPRIKR